MLPIYLASPYYSFHSDFVQGLSIPKSLSPVTLYGVGALTMWRSTVLYLIILPELWQPVEFVWATVYFQF